MDKRDYETRLLSLPNKEGSVQTTCDHFPLVPVMTSVSVNTELISMLATTKLLPSDLNYRAPAAAVELSDTGSCAATCAPPQTCMYYG